MRSVFASTCSLPASAALPKLQKEAKDLPVLYLSNLTVFICCFSVTAQSIPFFTAVAALWLVAMGLYGWLALRLHKRLAALGDTHTLSFAKLRRYAAYALGSYTLIVALLAWLQL